MGFKYFKSTLVVICLILSIFSGQIIAQEHHAEHADTVTSATPQLEAGEVVITGKIICLGCHLKKEKQAKAQCSIYGHTNALLIEKAIDKQGKHLQEAEGRIYQFLHNDKSDKLIKDHTYVGTIIVITGKIYPEANVLEVNFFKQKEGGK